MAYKSREELVGKRFISVKRDGKLKLSKVSDWEWRSGFVRAVSSRDSSNVKFTVLVEFDDTGWKSREYVKVHEVFQEFLVEHTLVWIGKKDSSGSQLKSALCFKPVVDKAGLFQHCKRPVESLSDRVISIVDERDITFYKEGDENTLAAAKDSPDVVKWIKAWTDYQDGQKILLTTPTVLLGYRVEVYRTEGTTQWYTAVIKSYNHANKSLTLTDDTVLEEHNEDPTLIQMHLIGDGVVDSILNGVDVGVAQRRRPRCTVTKQNSKDSASLITTTRPISVGSGGSTNNSACQSKASNSNTATPPATVVNNKVSKSRHSSTEASVSGTSAGSESGVKGQGLSKNSKQTPKRKSDPPTKVAKKLSGNKKIKKSASDENLETGTLVCKQTCNVLVKRIEEERNKQSELKDKPKTKSYRLRDKSVQNKKSASSECDKDIEQFEEASQQSVEDSVIVNKGRPNEENVSQRPKELQGILNEVHKDSPSHGLKTTNESHLKGCTNVTTTVSNDVLRSLSPTPITGNLFKKELNQLINKSNILERNDRSRVKGHQARLDEQSTCTDFEGKIAVNSTESVDKSYSNSDEDMHYKKQMLRAGGNISSHPSAQTLSISEEIDVNRSVTDQLAKRNNKNERFCVNGDKVSSEAADIFSSSSSFSSQRSETNSTLSKTSEFISDRQSAFTCVSSLSRSNTATPATEDRADSRASDSQLTGHLSDDKRPGSRLDDIRSVKSSPGSSPLVVDRHEAVHVYRDPELMRKNPVQSNVQNILAAQQKMNPPFPLSGGSATSQSVTAAPFSGVPSLSTRTLLSTIPPYTNPHQLTPSISHHLALPPHGYPMDVVRAQQQQQLVMQQLQMGAYNLATSSTLEALWQRKLPSNPLPTQWMHQKGPESLIAGDLAAAIHIHKLEQERREHERRELERIGERERMEQERREKERKELIERERIEKEKIEREKAERDRLEKERIDKERLERERQEWEHNQNQDRILRESVDTVAAVDQHFAESLTRLASQQGISMFPSITRGTGRGFIPKTETHHSLPSHSLPYDKQLDRKDKIKREPEPLPDDKRYLAKPSSEKASVFPNYSYNTNNFQPNSGITQPNQKPVFNLYGYPSSHSTITTEQLKQRGLISEPRQIKEETQDKKHFYSSISPAAHSSQPYLSKDIKHEAHSSVIVKRDTKPVIKMETPVAAHSHHNSPSSPRPQQPRPAHTPEHRPDRPLSSSTSPATGIHPHLLHHSNPVPSVQQTSHSTGFHSIETHSSPRSQSPYKPATSQPQPLNFCKSPNTLKKMHEQQPQVHSGYPAPIVPLPVSMPSSIAYSFSLIQQGLVPNPIYSQGGTPHTSGASMLQHNTSPLVSSLPTNLSQVTKPSQISPPGCKRKSGSKDGTVSNRKKPKGQSEMSLVGQPLAIPVTTPQIVTNPSPYTTSSSTLFSKPVTALSSALSSNSLPSINSLTYNDSFKSFVETTVQIAFLQDEKKAQEKAERERIQASVPNTKQEDRKSETIIQPVPSGTPVAALSVSRQDLPPTSDSYNSRIMETINRVANNQVDTDSDTLSASSPPPQSKPDNNSPVNKNISSSSGSSHPHHMKKAWLQRHDEDKKYETPVLSQCEEDSNPSFGHSRDVISCVENSSALSDHGHESLGATPANVVVTLPNGNVSDLNHNVDESTSSASESEMQDPATDFGTKKRVKPRKPSTGSAKKSKGDSDKESPVSTPPPSASNNGNNTNNLVKKNNTNKRNKSEKDNDKSKAEQGLNSLKQSRDDSPVQPKQDKNKMTVTSLQMVSCPSPHSERSNPSPALSENNIDNMSPASSTTSNSSNTATSSKSGNKSLNKDKKKTRRNKETTLKDSKKSSSFNKPLVKMTVANLKRTMLPFIQDGPCSEITPKLTKCRECKMTPVQRSKKQPNIFCRFYAFRRLRYTPRGIVTIHGFSELSDADPDDIEPWLPRFPIEEPDLDVENSKFIIAKVGDKFCELVEQEKEAKSWAKDDAKIVWKRAVMGVREMCDVCDTTLFNMHWVCQKCGFVVCLDCYKVRMKEGKKALIEDKWLTCSANRQAHKASEMMLTQIIPSDALWELGRLIHDIRTKWAIPSSCPCGGGSTESKLIPKNGINQQLLNAVNTRKLPNGFGSEEHNRHSKTKKSQESNPLKNLDSYNPDTTSSPLSILAEIATMEPESKIDTKRKSNVPDDSLEDTEKKSGCSTLRELLTKTAGKLKVTNDKKGKKGSGLSTLDHIIQSVVEKSCTDGSGSTPFKFLHYTPRLGGWKRELPIMVHNLTETSVLYPDVPHSWLCDGRLLRLHDAHHKGNLQIFQEQWKRGQPVLVSCANKKMNINLWKPEVFSKEFGHLENEVVNCRTGNAIIGHTMADFWDGFENLTNRPVDESDDPMLLKLKDWPPGDDFSELLPSRFQDLMQALPLPEYTQRNGKLNLASRLPDFLVRPDLGPKMYNAYGSSQFPKEGTTNLHLDISDAVNVMVYVGIPCDGLGGRKVQEEAAVKAIDDAGCDSITKRRVREVHEIPGALWHIYDAHDADKIRDFLNKVAKERGEIIEKDHDAIHDQSWYLDKELCDRLLKEYGVQGYTIVQCHGDAIFIPAGAPHQVRNLHSCVKVAEDFVSPEHLNHCFRLTQEFRQLSETHSNHEDKLQVKNIIYHAVKDAIAVLREHTPEDE